MLPHDQRIMVDMVPAISDGDFAWAQLVNSWDFCSRLWACTVSAESNCIVRQLSSNLEHRCLGPLLRFTNFLALMN
jgi:hypothetical protein